MQMWITIGALGIYKWAKAFCKKLLQLFVLFSSTVYNDISFTFLYSLLIGSSCLHLLLNTPFKQLYCAPLCFEVAVK